MGSNPRVNVWVGFSQPISMAGRSKGVLPEAGRFKGVLPACLARWLVAVGSCAGIPHHVRPAQLPAELWRRAARSSLQDRLGQA